MQKYTLLLLVILSVVEGPLFAQKPTSAMKANLTATDAPRALQLNMDSTITSSHTLTIKGQKVPYTAQVGTQPVWDEAGKVIAGVFYTYYERTDVKDLIRGLSLLTPSQLYVVFRRETAYYK